MSLKLSDFDARAYLDSEEVIAEYLTAALEDESPDVFLAAVGDVAKAPCRQEGDSTAGARG